MKDIVPLLAVALLMNGCITGSSYVVERTGEGYKYAYELELVEVEKPSQADKRYSPRKKEKASGKSYSDGMVEVTIEVADFYCGFSVKNKTSQVIGIAWRETAYSDTDNRSMAVLASEDFAFFGLIYRSEPTSIIPGSELGGMLLPKMIPREPESNEKVRLGGRHEYPHLFPLEKGENPDKYVGKHVRLLLPIVIEGETNDYIFTLEIKGFEEKNKKK